MMEFGDALEIFSHAAEIRVGYLKFMGVIAVFSFMEREFYLHLLSSSPLVGSD